MTYDFLIVGAGLTGATLARRLTDAGRTCLVVERRGHVGGNCHTELRNGILVHAYGPHYFHTNDERVWEWVNRFGRWRFYVPRVKAWVGGEVYSMPINLMTLNQLWGVTTPREAAEALAARRVEARGDTAEAHLLRTVGQELYETFFRGYTTKQWGRPPNELPSSIVSRIPVRLTYEDGYHRAKYQAVPEDGYTAVVEAMLEGIEVELGTEYREVSEGLARRIIYTGSLDALFGYRLGRLEYRSLRFEHELLPVDDFQGCAQMNYPDQGVPFTRVVEYRHIHGGGGSGTVITREFPESDGDPYYPIATSSNLSLARRYRRLAEEAGFLVGGRLAVYKYMDMDGAVAASLRMADRLLK